MVPRVISRAASGWAGDIRSVAETLKITALVAAFRDRGHSVATLDPLGRTLGPRTSEGEPAQGRDLWRLLRKWPQLDLESSGLGGIDPKQRYFLGDTLKIVRATQLFWTLEEVVALLRNSYCGTLTVEAAHLTSREQQLWMQAAMERPPSCSLFSPKEKRAALFRLLHTDHFERFLSKKFPASKRFGIEGCESLIPALYTLLERSAERGVEVVELGMAHRGRLNVLHTLLGKSLSSMVTEFKGPKFLHVGDVKYHLGTHSSLTFDNHKMQISLSPNPSHLEAVDPVVVGRTRARQFFMGDKKRNKVMGLLLHGDAAFSGLGLAAEVLQLAELPEYTTGGTVHVIVNNQIGFTTDPKLARSSVHPSDVAKAVGAPIFHVNGDDMEAVLHSCQLAADWRQKFQKDVVVDIVCYRRHGHNEQDDPSVTQPLVYTQIAEHPTTLQLYSKRLLEENVVTEEELKIWSSEVTSQFEEQFREADATAPTPQDWLATNWQGEALGSLSKQRGTQATGVHIETLKRVGRAVCRVPDGFHLHTQVNALLESRLKMIETGEGVDWAMAEALAFGSIMMNPDSSLGQTPEFNPAFPVRISGQDCERGTFNQRHAVIYDQKTAQRHVPLSCMAPGEQSPFLVCNSNLSEAAVLGFEYGFSLATENALVMWEAQFGDFANNAQLFIDNFIASGEDKWMSATNLVLLLPHGYDGQGPDHSSARLERFLQLCSDDPDHLPGLGPQHTADIEAGFSAADREGKGYLTRADLMDFMVTKQGLRPKHVDLLLNEFDLGPSGRIERQGWKLFMAQWMRRNAEKDHNLCVVNVTTPANFFHVLRRQVSRPYSKPLVVMAPKFLLHHSACTSKLADMAPETYFRRVIADGDLSDNQRHLTENLLPRQEIQRVLLCTGKVYYLLLHARRARKIRHVAIVRLEQIAPLAMDRLATIIKRYPNSELVWVQEEPKNMGAWSYMQPRLQTAIRELCKERKAELSSVRYVGRVPSASPATGSHKIHQQETKALIDAAFLN